MCAWTALITSGAAQQICLGGTTSGGAELYVQNYGTAPAQPLTLDLNGTLYQFPFSGMGAGNVVGPATTAVGDLVIWNNATGTLVKDSNVLPNNIFFGSGMPWIDVRSGANGCAAATGNGSTDDTAAIQCQLNFLHNTGVGGQVAGKLYLPCGEYVISSELTVYSGTHIEGESRRCTLIDTNSADITAITVPASGSGNDYTLIEHILIAGSMSTSASNNLVIVGSNAVVNIDDTSIIGGNFALENHGIDGIISRSTICGTNTSTGGCIEEYGANWYIRVKMDGTAEYGWYITTGAREMSCVTCDFSGTFTYGIYVNSSNAVAMITNSVIGAPVDIVSAAQVSIGTSEIGTTVTSASPLLITGSKGVSAITVGGAGTITCAANLNIICPTLANAISTNVALNNTSNYFDGPSVGQGTSGTWFAIGQVTLSDTAGNASFRCKLWDGTTIVSSGALSWIAGTGDGSLSLSGFLATPAANIKISCRDITSTSGVMNANVDGSSNTASSLSVQRVN